MRDKGVVPMSIASPLRVERWRDRIQCAVDAWRVDWGFGESFIRINARPCEPTRERPVPGLHGSWRDAVEGFATLFVPEGVEEALLRVMFPTLPQGDAPIARECAAVAAQELNSALAQVCGVASGNSHAGPDWAVPRWAGPLQVEIEIDETCRWIAIVTTAALPELTRPSGARPGPVGPRAFAEIEAQTELVIGRAQLSLADAAALEVGDVVVLDTRLDEPAQLLVGGGGARLFAYLGRRGDRRAAQLVSFPIPSNGNEVRS